MFLGDIAIKLVWPNFMSLLEHAIWETGYMGVEQCLYYYSVCIIVSAITFLLFRQQKSQFLVTH